jgi:hypothetical protein
MILYTHLFGFVLGGALLWLSFLCKWLTPPYWILLSLSYILIFFSIRRVMRIPWEAGLTRSIISAIEKTGLTLESFVEQ